MLTLDLEHGAIRLASISLLACNKDAIFLDIDCNSKYPEVNISSGDKTEEIILSAGERTLRCSEKKQPTRIIVPKPSGNWSLFLNIGKYTIYFRLIRQKGAKAHRRLDTTPSKILFK